MCNFCVIIESRVINKCESHYIVKDYWQIENFLDVKISFYRLIAIFGVSEERERGLYVLGNDLAVTALIKYH